MLENLGIAGIGLFAGLGMSAELAELVTNMIVGTSGYLFSLLTLGVGIYLVFKNHS